MNSKLSNAVRAISADIVCNANSGHLGVALGMADCLTVLFKEHLQFSAKHPDWFNRDRFIMSGGHGSALLYSLLYLSGYVGITKDDIRTFRKIESKATGHPEYCVNNGIEMTTGPLGEGLGSAVGIAIAERILNNRLGNDCVNHFTYVSIGDGDLMEGISHEACAIAGHLGLGKLIVLFDDNNTTIDGSVNLVSSEEVKSRFKSYNWHVLATDGHDHKSISEAIKNAKACTDMPSIIFCKTKIGYGSCFEGTPAAHCGIMNNTQLREFKKRIGYEYEKFELPNEIINEWHKIGSRNDSIYEQWIAKHQHLLSNIKTETDEAIKTVVRHVKKEFFVNRPFSSTRAVSGCIIRQLCEASRYIISGSCDLGESTCCKHSTMKDIVNGDFSGNYINCGIREHAMCAIINGLTLHGGLKAFGGTFLSFSDYMRPAIRLSALMNIPSIFVFTHDSIGVGEDGPTHQPVEQLAGLRAMPNLNVFRPGDPLETLECWENALESQTPSVLLLTRQSVTNVRFCGRDNLCANGAYLLYEDMTASAKSVLVLATGSELGLALEVRNILAKEHSVCAHLASMPCWRLFEQQPENYKKVLLEHGTLKVGIEAACDFGWQKYIGTDGLFFGVNDFGKSASCLDNFNYFGLNSKEIVNVILDKLCGGSSCELQLTDLEE